MLKKVFPRFIPLYGWVLSVPIFHPSTMFYANLFISLCVILLTNKHIDRGENLISFVEVKIKTDIQRGEKNSIHKHFIHLHCLKLPLTITIRCQNITKCGKYLSWSTSRPSHFPLHLFENMECCGVTRLTHSNTGEMSQTNRILTSVGSDLPCRNLKSYSMGEGV